MAALLTIIAALMTVDSRQGQVSGLEKGGLVMGRYALQEATTTRSHLGS
jgi:hypothetical protein